MNLRDECSFVLTALFWHFLNSIKWNLQYILQKVSVYTVLLQVSCSIVSMLSVLANIHTLCMYIQVLSVHMTGKPYQLMKNSYNCCSNGMWCWQHSYQSSSLTTGSPECSILQWHFTLYRAWSCLLPTHHGLCSTVLHHLVILCSKLVIADGQLFAAVADSEPLHWTFDSG